MLKLPLLGPGSDFTRGGSIKDVSNHLNDLV